MPTQMLDSWEAEAAAIRQSIPLNLRALKVEPAGITGNQIVPPFPPSP